MSRKKIGKIVKKAREQKLSVEREAEHGRRKGEYVERKPEDSVALANWRYKSKFYCEMTSTDLMPMIYEHLLRTTIFISRN